MNSRNFGQARGMPQGGGGMSGLGVGGGGLGGMRSTSPPPPSFRHHGGGRRSSFENDRHMPSPFVDMSSASGGGNGNNNNNNMLVDACLMDISRRRVAMARQVMARAAALQESALGLGDFDPSSSAPIGSNGLIGGPGNMDRTGMGGGGGSGMLFNGRGRVPDDSAFQPEMAMMVDNDEPAAFFGMRQQSRMRDEFGMDPSSMRGSSGFFNPRSQFDRNNFPDPMGRSTVGVSNVGAGLNAPPHWFVCSKCEKKAFASQGDCLDHEDTCFEISPEVALTNNQFMQQQQQDDFFVRNNPDMMPRFVPNSFAASDRFPGIKQENNCDRILGMKHDSNSDRFLNSMKQDAAAVGAGRNPFLNHNFSNDAGFTSRMSMMQQQQRMHNNSNSMVNSNNVNNFSNQDPIMPEQYPPFGSFQNQNPYLEDDHPMPLNMNMSSVINPKNMNPMAQMAQLVKEDEDPAANEHLYTSLPKPLPLAMLSDKDWITPLHCFVRRHCVEVFTATPADVATPSKGKRRPIQVGQVGIRCPHCHSSDNKDTKSSFQHPGRERGSVYYPTSISSIYNATMNLLQRHLHSCACVPAEIMQRYGELKADDARSGTSKKYWIDSAKSLGLVDTMHGIRFSALTPPPLPRLTTQQAAAGMGTTMRRNSVDLLFSSTSNAVNHDNDLADDHSKDEDPDEPVAVDTSDLLIKAENNSNHSNDPSMDHEEQCDLNPITDNSNNMDTSLNASQEPPLVAPEDETTATKFSFALLSQMQPCVFTEADRLGKRKGLPAGFAGLACRHCYGGYGSGRFFPSSIKTMSDTSKTLNVLYSHMMRCRKCPKEVREKLESLRVGHDEERAKMKFGSQKAFFAKIWQRLHGEKPPRGTAGATASVTQGSSSNTPSVLGVKRKEPSSANFMPARSSSFPFGANGGAGTQSMSGMSGMTGMSGMSGLSGMSGMSADAMNNPFARMHHSGNMGAGGGGGGSNVGMSLDAVKRMRAA